MTDRSILQKSRRVLHSLWNSDGRQIIYYCARLGLGGETGYPITRTLRYMRHPTAHLRRKSARALIKRDPAFENLVDRKTGYGVIPAGTLPGTDKIVELVRKLRDERDSVSTLRGEPFRETILGPGDLHTYPELREFATSDAILQIASDYLGGIPVLAATLGWWSKDNDYLESSQLYHVDSNDRHELKFFINIEDVGPNDGPFTFIPADTTERIIKKIDSPRRRIEDEEIFAHCTEDDVIEATGPAGTTFAVDGCRCMHFGARMNGGTRLVLLVEFYSYFSPMSPQVPMNPSPDWYPGDKLRSLALGLE